MMRVLTALTVIAMARGAHADDTIEPTRAPGFVTLLRQDLNSRVGGDMTYLRINGDASGMLLRFDLHGHYVDPVSGLGAYGQLPITWISPDSNGRTALGGIEVGGIYVPKLSAPDLGVVFRAGITLPTVTDENAGYTALLATLLRPSDVMTMMYRSSTLRLAASPMLRSGQFFARGDFGLDINVYNDGEGTENPALIVGGGAGADLGGVAIMGEISMLAITGDGGDTVSSAALSVRGSAGSVQPYGALLIPVDNDVRRVFHPSFLLGVEGRL